MTNRYVLIGVTVGVFFAGLGVGYTIFINSFNPYQMMYQNPTMLNQLIQNNPQFAGRYMGYMMQDPQLWQQMYGYMLQNKNFMYGIMGNQNFQNQYMGPWMMQNPNFQRQWTSPNVPSNQFNNTSIPQNAGPGSYMGSGMMGSGMMGSGFAGNGYNQNFRTIPIKDVISSASIPDSAQVAKGTITLGSQNPSIVALSMGGEEAKNMTASLPPSYAKADAFVIGGMIDPTIVVKSGTRLNMTLVNLDEDMEHNLAIMTTPPPYSYMPMSGTGSGGAGYGGVIAMTPILPYENEQGSYAYGSSYQVTLSQPGTYWYVCTYPGHAEEGMYGKIVVQ